MTSTLPVPAASRAPDAPPDVPIRPALADGVAMLGPVQGSGYRDGTGLVRRRDGQMIQLSPLMYAVLDESDGQKEAGGLADAVSRRLGRTLSGGQVHDLCVKLAAQGLLAGTEDAAPPRANPLLALRWKFLVTNPAITRRITAPFAMLFSGWIMWPALAAFGMVCWYVLFDRGLAGATAQAFRNPGLLLVIFALAVLSAGIHEFGHAAACRAGGATPGGMGAGLYVVWPAFYTDVTDAYRLDRRGRLRVDLGGLYFNVLVAVVTAAVWLAIRNDTLLLLVGLQLLQMVKQLSPVIRADGYHILADATGVPDLYAHLGPTLRRLLPGGRREPSPLTGRARALVTIWVLVIVPVLLSLMVGAVLVLPRLATSAWDSGRQIADAIPHDVSHGNVISVLAALLRLVALALPVVGSSYIALRLAKTAVRRGHTWSRGRPGRRLIALTAAAALVAGLAWAWWPSGQYQPVRASERGTVGSLVHLLGAPRTVSLADAAPTLAPGRRLALTMVPVGGPSPSHPVLIVLPGARDGAAPTGVLTDAGAGSPATRTVDFPFQLPSAPGPGDSQALAVNTTDHRVVYNIDYAIVTVSDGSPVTNTNSAFALADCSGCTTVAVSFQVVLVIGQSDRIAPINAAGALNANCVSCLTTAMADQLVLTLRSVPPATLLHRLTAALQKLNDLRLLGANGTPQAISAQVTAVQNQIITELTQSGLLVMPSPSASSQVVATTSPGPSQSGSPAPDPTASSSTPAETTPSATPSSSTPTSPAASVTPSATPTGAVSP